MPTNILRPVADGTWTNNLSLGAGGSKAAAIDPGDPVSHDDNTSYIVGELSTNYSCQVTNVPGPIGTVVAYQIGHRSRIGSGEPGNARSYARAASTNGTFTTSNTTADNNYTTMGPTDANRPGGGSWVGGDFVDTDDATQLACEHNGNDVVTLKRTTSLWGELNYLPPSGGFIFLIGQWMPWIAGLHGVMDYSQIVAAFRSMPEMAHYKHGVPSLREDFEAIREFLRRRPAYGI